MDKEHRNYYEVLEIPINASPEQIYEGYVRAKNAYAGDSLALYSLMTEDECQSMLELIEQAYSVLCVPNKRREYDKVKGFNQQQWEEGKEANFNNNSSNEFTHDENLTLQGQDRPLPQINPGGQSPFVKSNSDGPQTPTRSTAQGQMFQPKGEKFSIRRHEAEVSKISAQKRFSLAYDKDADMEQKIENTIHFTGEILGEIREYKNVSVERMADMTKISKTYIKCIESDDYDKLPALAYVRGFVFQYAKCLKLNPELVATSYLHHLKSLKENAS